jgi:hypothetical protein
MENLEKLTILGTIHKTKTNKSKNATLNIYISVLLLSLFYFALRVALTKKGGAKQLLLTS